MSEYTHVLKLVGAGCLLTGAVMNPLLSAQRNSLTEFYDRNPDCTESDTESIKSLLHSCFKKTESFRLVLLAMAGAFFICRLA